MNHFNALAVILAASPALAQAQCPTAEDLTKGIRFEIEGGDRETYRSFASGVIAATYESSEPPASRVLLAQGVYLLELVDLAEGPVGPDSRVQPGSRTTYSYPMKAPDMPVPAPGGSWQVTAAMLSQGEIGSEKQHYGFGAMTRISFGACAYDMFPIEITYPGEDGGTVDLLHYLPALGLSYLAASTYDGSTDRYNYIAIEALK